MFAALGQGVAVMADSNNAIVLGNKLVASITREYCWKFTPLQSSADDVLVLIANVTGTLAALEKYGQLRR
jgi:hypothetical protein